MEIVLNVQEWQAVETGAVCLVVTPEGNKTYLLKLSDGNPVDLLQNSIVAITPDTEVEVLPDVRLYPYGG